MILKRLKTSNEILHDCHDYFIKPGCDNRSMQSDTKIVFSDGILYYSKVLVSFVIPGLRTILSEPSEEICQTILFPAIRKEEFITAFSKCFQTKSKYEESSQAPSCQTHSEDLKLFIGEESKNKSEGEIHRDSLTIFSEGLEVGAEGNDESLENSASTNAVDEVLGNNNWDDGQPSDFLCHSCGKSFPNAGKLKRHMYNVHHNAMNLFQCNLCEKRFSSKEYLSRHKSENHKLSTNQCRTCLNIFKTIIELKRHEKSHKASQKEFKCQVCGKINEKKSNHERHLLLHDKSKHFQCDICTMQFTLKQHLERHKMTHDKKVCVFCPKCHRSFGRKENMKRHLLTCKTKFS